jgi:hypothetical protein
MVSETSIANQALGFLGENPIISFNDKTPVAQLMRDNYPFIRDAVLTEVAWTFATARTTSTVEDRDDWDQFYKHPIPLEWMQVLRTYRNVNNDRKLISNGWVREGSFILAKDATVFMWGITRVTDTALFSPAFVQCLSTRLAMDLCIAITENVTRHGTLMQEYGIKVREAAISDGVQGFNEVIESNSLIDARAGGGSFF